jgi:hypothetical protein
MVYFCFEYFDRWLGHSEVGHLEAESVELDPLDALVDVAGQAGLAYFIQPNIVTHGNILMELPVQVVDISEVGCVLDELRPVVGVGEGPVFALILINDFREVPGEGQHVGVLLLGELHVNSNLPPLLINVEGGLFSRFFLNFKLSSKISLRNIEQHGGGMSSCSSKGHESFECYGVSCAE